MGQSPSTEEDQDDGECRLYNIKVSDKQWPIVYADEYNISFGGLERVHPFDSGKWGKIYKHLKGTAPRVLADLAAAGLVGSGEVCLIWVLVSCCLRQWIVTYVHT